MSDIEGDNELDIPPRTANARIACGAGLVTSLSVAVVSWASTGTGATRLAMLLGIVSAWALGLVLAWRLRAIRYALLALALVVSVLCLSPRRDHDVSRLRSSYLESLVAYDGAPYRWGGENGLGIDCSGLVRRALIDALFREGVLGVDGGLIRDGLHLWWFDRTAKALADGYRGDTRQHGGFSSINDIDPAALSPGDLAVTQDGIHVLAYLGDRVWIEADPGLMRVVRVQVPAPDNPWFQVPVYLVRWAILSATLSVAR